MKFKLNNNQLDYLKYSLTEEQIILKLKLKEFRRESQFVVIEIDKKTADEIRDWASVELQRKGFNLNYELTPEGKILEELIDLFYIK